MLKERKILAILYRLLSILRDCNAFSLLLLYVLFLLPCLVFFISSFVCFCKSH
jgi:hypothetical protein